MASAGIETRSNERLDELLARARPQLRAILLHFRIPEQDAEDLVQDVVLNLISRRDEVESPEAWLIAGMRYRCLMYWRSRRRCLYRTVDQTLLESLSEPQEDETESREIAHDLSRLLPQIPPRCRSVLKLRYTLGLRPPEVAEELGYRRSSIAQITKRCLAALSQKLIGVGYCEEPGV